MAEFLATAAIMFATFGLGMVGMAVFAYIAVLDQIHGRRKSEWLRRTLDGLDAKRELKAQRLARRAHQKNSSKDA